MPFRLRLAPLLSLGMTLLALSASQSHALIVPSSNRIIALGTSSMSEGWILTDQRLLWSNDDGSTWRDSAYIAPPAGRLQAAQFIDGHVGWIVGFDNAGTYVVHTTDAGRTWDPPSYLPIQEENPAGAALSFISQKIGYLMLKLPSSSNFSRGALFRTDDGGRSWLLLPVNPPIGGEVRFFTDQIGWLAGGPTGDKLFVTRDGGHSWATVTVAPAIQSGLEWRYLLPIFDSLNEGLLPVRVKGADSASITVYGTRDGGFSWAPLQSAAHEPPKAGFIELPEHVIITPGESGRILTFARLGGASYMRPEPSRGIPPGFNVTLAAFPDALRGWVSAAAGQCAGFKIGCWKESRILRTRDGGVSFNDITPPFLLDLNRNAMNAAQNDLRQPSRYPAASTLLGAGTRLMENFKGFDALCLPDATAMQTWWHDSPYWYVGTYLGGANASCRGSSSCPCPPASWFSQVAPQGWTFLPIWVGVQASGLTDPTSAFTQGVMEADSAADRMAALGFPLGSIVYYDFESPSSTASVQAFVNGWVSELHVRGQNAGIYGSYLSAAAWQGSNVPNQPDAIWPYDLNVGAMVFGLCGPTPTSYCLPDSLWANHQRIHQFTQCNDLSCAESYPSGTSGYIVDEDYADGPVATFGAAPGAILVNATLDGSFWPIAASGVLGWKLTGPANLSGGGVPESFSGEPLGTYTIQYLSGGPTGAPPANVTTTQTLTANRSIVFTFNFASGGGVCSAGHGMTSTSCTPPPTVTLAANPTNITAGSSSTLTWSTTNASSCLASGSWSGSQATSGTLSVSPSGTSAYTLTCSGAGGSAAQSATVTVSGSAAPPAVYLSAFPQQSTSPGAAVGLGWATSNAVSCTASGGWSGGQPLSGGTTVFPSTTTTYTLTCSGTGGASASNSVTVAVTSLVPTVNLALNPPAINPGGSSILQWSTTGMASCSASGGWSGSEPLSGSQQVSPASTTTYFLTCTSASQSPQQLVSNGAFAGTVTQWTLSGDFFADSRFSNCHSCPGYAYLSDPSGSLSLSNNLFGSMTQDISLPSTASSIALSYWVNISTLETTTTTPSDVLSVSFVNTAGGSPQLIRTFSNLDAGGYRQATFDLTPYKGQTIHLEFIGTTNPTLGTVFRVDDVSVLATFQSQQYTMSATLTVNPPSPPGLALTATPDTITPGQTSTLFWSSGGTTSCTASNGWSGAKPTAGNQVVAPSTTTTYTLTCSGPGGSVTSSATVVVQSPPPTVTLSANPTSILAGASSTLSWSSTNAANCTAFGIWASEGAKPTSGSELVFPTQTATYSLSCTGPGGTATGSAVVQVTPHTITFSAGPTGTPNPVASGGSVQLSATAVDSLGHALGYSWSASCSGGLGNGMLVNPTSSTPTWTAFSNNTGVKQPCTLAATASDGTGLSQTASFAEMVNPQSSCFSLALAHTGVGNDPAASPSSSLGCAAGQYLAGATVSLLSSPAGGWTIGSWMGTDNNSSQSTGNTLTMPASDVTTTVNYVVVPGPPLNFFTLSPCRVIDTRNPTGPYGGPLITAGAFRFFTLSGQCGIPSTARAVSANVTVVAPSNASFLLFFPGDSIPPPPVSTINFRAGQVRANNAILLLSAQPPGAIGVLLYSGSAQVIVDVNGYFN